MSDERFQWVSAGGYPVPEGNASLLTEMIGPRPDTGNQDLYGKREPQAFLAHRGPDAVIRPHFHPVGQYQYVVSGGGRIGRAPAGAGVVQWADALQTYGPITPAADGMAFLTLRATTDGGVFYMPESRTALTSAMHTSGIRAGDRRNVVVNLLDAVGSTAGRWAEAYSDDDGLRLAVGRFSGTVASPAIAGIGAYLVVISGAVRETAKEFGPGSVAWCAPGTRSTGFDVAGSTVIGLLQFPVVSTAVNLTLADLVNA